MIPRQRETRLASPPKITEMFRRGTTTRHGRLTLWSVRTDTGLRRAGLIVRSRHGRLKSHERQRARRLLREVVRRHQHALRSSVDLLLVWTCAPETPPVFEDVKTAFLTACTAQHLLNDSA